MYNLAGNSSDSVEHAFNNLQQVPFGSLRISFKVTTSNSQLPELTNTGFSCSSSWV